MNEINLPYHLIIPSLISIIALGIIFINRKRLFVKGKWKWFWISITLFVGIYLLIVGGATYVDISSKLALQEFDLNRDGFFSGNEITPEQKTAMQKVIADTGRNFSVITGLFFSGIITFFVFIGGKILERINTKRTQNNA